MEIRSHLLSWAVIYGDGLYDDFTRKGYVASGEPSSAKEVAAGASASGDGGGGGGGRGGVSKT